LALRHREVAVDAPEQGEGQHHPGDVPRLGEETGGVVGRGDDLFVAASVCHGYSPSRPGMIRTRSPSTSRLAPLTITLSPAPIPASTATRLPEMRPNVTSRARAWAPSSGPSATNTAKPPARADLTTAATETVAAFGSMSGSLPELTSTLAIM